MALSAEEVRHVAMLARLALTDDETEKRRSSRSGKFFVPMSTRPPLKLPGRSGVKVFSVTMLSSRLDGKRSNCTAFLSGSALGMSTPLSCVLE